MSGVFILEYVHLMMGLVIRLIIMLYPSFIFDSVLDTLFKSTPSIHYIILNSQGFMLHALGMKTCLFAVSAGSRSCPTCSMRRTIWRRSASQSHSTSHTLCSLLLKVIYTTALFFLSLSFIFILLSSVCNLWLLMFHSGIHPPPHRKNKWW